MKTLVMSAVLIASFFASLNAVHAQTTTSRVINNSAEITGYDSKEYGVEKDKFTKQLKSVADQIATDQKSVSGKEGSVGMPKTSIKVTGCTDGLSVNNDGYGQNRAEQVRSSLLYRFANANVVADSAGATCNSRKVIVSWTITPAPPALAVPPMPTLQQQRMWLTPLLGVCMALGLGGIIFFRLREQKHQSETQTETQTIEVEWEGRTYLYTFPKVNGIWRTDFLFWNGEGNLFYHKDAKNARQGIKKCVAHPSNKPVIEKLIAKEKLILKKR